MNHSQIAVLKQSPVALGDMNVPQLAEACHMLDACQERYNKLSGICAAMRGLVLTEAKRKIEHGYFTAWIAKNFKKTKKTAAEDMRIAREFAKSNPRVTFETLGRDLATTVAELEEAQIDLKHPLVRHVAEWVGDRTRYQLLLAFPASRGGNQYGRGGEKGKRKKTTIEVIREGYRKRAMAAGEACRDTLSGETFHALTSRELTVVFNVVEKLRAELLDFSRKTEAEREIIFQQAAVKFLKKYGSK